MADQMEKQIRDLAGELKTLRDELKVRMHLAGLEVRDRWRDLEPRLSNPERLVREASETGRGKLMELRDTLRDLLERARRDEHGNQPGA